LNIRKKVFGEDHPDYVLSLNNMAGLYSKKGDYSAAESIYKQVLAIRKRVSGEGHPLYVASINSLAALYANMGNYTAALSLYKQATVIVKRTLGVEHVDYALNLHYLSRLYVQMGNYVDAENPGKEALTIRKKILGENHPDYAASLNNLANLYQNTGNYIVSESFYKQALAIRKKVLGEQHTQYAQSLNDLAMLYYIMGNYAASELLYQQSLAIIKRRLGEDNPNYASNLSNLAVLYFRMGNFEAAERLNKQALSICKKVLKEEHPDYSRSLNNLAHVYYQKGDYATAELLWKQGLSIAKKVFGEDHPNYATTLNNLAGLYERTGNYVAAEILFKKSIAIRAKAFGHEHPNTEALSNLAFLYFSWGKYTEAESLWKQVLMIERNTSDQHPDHSLTLNNMACLYECMGNYALAAKYLISSTDLTFTYIEKNFYTLSEFEKLKWWESIERNFEGAPSLLRTNPFISTLFLQQTCTHQLKLKGFVLNDGAKTLENVRKNSNPPLRRLLDQWQSTKASLARQYILPPANRIANLDSLERQTNEQEKQINLQSSSLRASLKNQQIGFNEVRLQLKKDEAAIEFIRFEYYNKEWTDSVFYSAFVILPGDTLPHFVTLCEEKQLASLLDSKSNLSAQFINQLYRGIIVNNQKAVDGKKGDSLYNLIWRPLQPWLKGIRKISIAPAGLLNRVAFNALPVDDNTYLIDKYQLRQFSSVRQLAEEEISIASTEATFQAVLYGGIDYRVAEAKYLPKTSNQPNTIPDDIRRNFTGNEWMQLPGTLQEVNNISQLFKSNREATRVITGATATEESLKQLSGHSPAILHLATHGFSLPDARQERNNYVGNNDNLFAKVENPLMRCGIIMAGGNRVWGGAAPVPGKEDGIVTAYEISNLDFSNTELVVLSACETALGDIKGTEGVFGLKRAFKLAGAQNLILSLWQVPDNETSELMTLFYTSKLQGMPTYEAFKKAQDHMRKKYPPFYWAAFVLTE
jgi:CHAT domain-containing protein/Tfp pilus assembly protein PilF